MKMKDDIYFADSKAHHKCQDFVKRVNNLDLEVSTLVLDSEKEIMMTTSENNHANSSNVMSNNEMDSLDLSQRCFQSTKNLYQIAFTPTEEFSSLDFEVNILNNEDTNEGFMDEDEESPVVNGWRVNGLRQHQESNEIRRSDEDGFHSLVQVKLDRADPGQCNQSHCYINQLSLAEEMEVAERSGQWAHEKQEEIDELARKKKQFTMSSEQSSGLPDDHRLLKTSSEQRNKFRINCEPNELRTNDNGNLKRLEKDIEQLLLSPKELHQLGTGQHLEPNIVQKDIKCTDHAKQVLPNVAQIRLPKSPLPSNLCIINNPPGALNTPYSVKNYFCCAIV